MGDFKFKEGEKVALCGTIHQSILSSGKDETLDFPAGEKLHVVAVDDKLYMIAEKHLRKIEPVEPVEPELANIGYRIVSLTQELSSLSSQVGGSHYKGLPVPPIIFCTLNNLGPSESSIVRYATRHRLKGGSDDVEKIIHYAKILLQLEYGYSNEQIKNL